MPMTVTSTKYPGDNFSFVFSDDINKWMPAAKRERNLKYYQRSKNKKKKKKL
jgi:hypothetical protein